MYRGISRSLLLVLGLAAVLLVPTPSFAQMYVGVYSGAVIPHDAETGGAGLLEGISASDTEFDVGVMMGGRVGYWLEALDAPFLGLEVEVYGGLPKISDQTITLGGVVVGDVPIQESDFDMITVAFNALLRYPSGPIQPYVGAGLGIVNATADNIKISEPLLVTIPGFVPVVFPTGSVLISGGDDTAPALQVIGGVRGFIADNVALFAEYKWVTAALEFEEFDLDYNASHVYGGIEFYFGPGVHKE